jgi:hypothetical protein
MVVNSWKTASEGSMLHFALFYSATPVASCNGIDKGQKQVEN